jgi:hypothetical protein
LWPEEIAVEWILEKAGELGIMDDLHTKYSMLEGFGEDSAQSEIVDIAE